ncbi:gp44 [Salisaeta icosahedral phage 1]|uniref:gp44 n=1 Tax=Salisaeta icosahedral phage 1 TaxID=1183239 RepID=UPI00025EA939|nr:gp44 [Salisaeta icosahedral phage 1]AFJ21499.1 gp44 [Salisaeta icosahedral phage 1]
MPLEIRDLGHYTAVIDTETGQIVRKAHDNKTPDDVHEDNVLRAQNPAELVVHENPSGSCSCTQPSDEDSIMNDAQDYANQYVDVLSQGASILAGDIIAEQIVSTVDTRLLAGQSSTVRKGVKIAAPAALGVVLYNATDNKILQGVAVGHGLTSVRFLVKEGLNMLSSKANSGTTTGGSGDSSQSGVQGGVMQTLQGRSGRALADGRAALPGVAGGYAANQYDSNVNVSSVDNGVKSAVSGV